MTDDASACPVGGCGGTSAEDQARKKKDGYIILLDFDCKTMKDAKQIADCMMPQKMLELSGEKYIGVGKRRKLLFCIKKIIAFPFRKVIGRKLSRLRKVWPLKEI